MTDIKPILCVDFDGVLHSYTSGWQGADVVSDPPVHGAMQWLQQATRYFTVAIYSSRSHQPNGILAMQVWLKLALARVCEEEREYLETYSLIEWPTHKPSAMLTIDDRALTFTGNWLEFAPHTLRRFQPWNKAGATVVQRDKYQALNEAARDVIQAWQAGLIEGIDGGNVIIRHLQETMR